MRISFFVVVVAAAVASPLMYVSRSLFFYFIIFCFFFVFFIYTYLYMDMIFRLSAGDGSCPPLFGWRISCDLLLLCATTIHIFLGLNCVVRIVRKTRDGRGGGISDM